MKEQLQLNQLKLQQKQAGIVLASTVYHGTGVEPEVVIKAAEKYIKWLAI